ncbi:MAG: DNA polymerase IV [Dialister sp.]|nr:DNA polymerase IV [Dialister sp.]
MRRRWIMHVDMDAFYASVEQRDHEELRGKPVIVGGASKRGVVSTASYEARAFGVHSAMPVAQARRLCPSGIFVEPRFEVYKAVSDEIHQVMLHYADGYEPLSLDEAFLDISGMGSQYQSLTAIGRAIKREIFETVRLVASVGIGPNKFLAKMASDMDKPDGLTIIPYGREQEILTHLPVRRLWGVGRVTEKKLLARGYKTIGDIQRASEEALRPIFGNQARAAHLLSLGHDDRPVELSRDIKSISDESTYEEDLTDRAAIERQIAIHADVVASRLRRYQMAGRTVTLKIRFASFRSVTRSVTLEDPTDLGEELYQSCMDLLSRVMIREGIRLIGVTVSNLLPALEIPSLFSEEREKRKKAALVMDSIQNKFGKEALRRGIWVMEEILAKQAEGKRDQEE